MSPLPISARLAPHGSKRWQSERGTAADHITDRPKVPNSAGGASFLGFAEFPAMVMECRHAPCENHEGKRQHCTQL